MAEIPYQVDNTDAQGDKGQIKVVWPNMGNGDTGQPYPTRHFADKAVQVAPGAWGVGGAVQMEGSLEALPSPANPGAVPSNYSKIRGQDGNAVAFNASSEFSLEQLVPFAVWTRPNVLTGDEDTDITVILRVRG